MSQDKKPITAYKELLDIPEQKQNLPGLEGKMDPLAQHTQMEAWDDQGNPYLVEYKGSGKLKGKAAIITGGDRLLHHSLGKVKVLTNIAPLGSPSGIGRAVAYFFVREGADVTITYLKQEKEEQVPHSIPPSAIRSRSFMYYAPATPPNSAEKVKDKIEKEEGGKCHIVECDLIKHEDCERVVKEHMQKYGKMSILVNNASKQIMCEDIADIDLKNVESTFQSNIVAMIAMAKYAVPHMKRGSTIVNSTSVTAFKGSPAMVDYSSTKGAIATFTRSLGLQLASKGIRVNAVAPGPVLTPLQPASRPKEQMDDWEVNKLPLWGRAGMPAELAASYVSASERKPGSGKPVLWG
ncbi:hypothetical protein QFC22_003092 [Naganishia vaughanmartiniae]|uniref:Uncharacterized protein n=1 Tax=Naganishia vaughanmartiniae TaxID=1424756 RepID=A0ACC2XA60_9TREE|nr:hypothetical protein QFC22_003092 [Naganishia vaughanmartiniae]